MATWNAVSRTLLVPVLALVLYASPLMVSDAIGQAVPLAWTADDPALEWVDCPEFFPEGCRLAVLQGDPAEPNADVLLRLAPDTRVPEHWHTSAERMTLLSGQMRVAFGDQVIDLPTGSYAYAPAGLPHTAHCLPGNECLLFIAFEEPVDAVLVDVP